MVHLDMPAIGLGWEDTYTVHDEITGQDWQWGAHNFVHLDPFHEPAHVLTVRRTA
jgi:starch synthase (maltosyl-transferring)